MSHRPGVTLYQHYKNKPYKYVGTARHSETQEEFVIYETCYEHAGDRVWIRPKAMFHEVIDVDGKPRPRFAQVSLRFEEKSGLSENDLRIIGGLMASCFGEWDADRFQETLRNHTRFHLILASIGEELVGFKLGYEVNSREFYSWLGGVLPPYRGFGIARELLRRQHDWCRSQKYLKVTTKTRNHFRQMLLLNVKEGFCITGILSGDEAEVVLEKSL